jgi:hypothetical protein
MATTAGADQQTAGQQTSETGDRWQLPRPLELSLRSKLEICEAAYHAGEPLAVAEALTLFFLYFKPPEWTEWIEPPSSMRSPTIGQTSKLSGIARPCGT